MTDPGYSLKIQPPALAISDFYASMSAMNKASLVALHERGIIRDELASRIAGAIQVLIVREQAPGARRSHDYLDFEPELIGLAGQDATWLHVGRSRQDMLSTGVSLWLRAAHLAVFEDLLESREHLLRLAAAHADTVLPTYTHGVQAQPTSGAQFFLAFAAAMERIAARLMESYARANRSPLGAGAGTTSAFAIDRPRLAALLGFDGVVENAFDANLVAPIDSALELVAILSVLAVQIGQWTQDVHAQFYLSEPWLVLAGGSNLNGISSMMPQKRNPRVLELLREHASIIIGSAQSMTLLAHNAHSGMTDVRESVTSVVPLQRSHTLLFLFARTLEAVVIDPTRSLAEVNRDYSAMTSLAEYLVQAANVPFRVAHEFASALTDYGRRNRLAPPSIPYAEACRVYLEHTGTPLAIPEDEFARAIDPVHVVATRRGLGGPQPSESERMLGRAHTSLAADRTWLAARRASIQHASDMLEDAFSRLARASTPPGADAAAPHVQTAPAPAT